MESIIRRIDPPIQNALRGCAFGLLGATTRDTKQRILALEEEQGLYLDADQCAKARQDLTNPRVRLSCELEWLPGLSPKRANDYLDLIDKDLDAYFNLAGFEKGIVKANLVSAGLALLGEENSANDWAELILSLINATDEIDALSILSMLNEDRVLADFPPIQSVEAVETDLVSRFRIFRDCIRACLDRMGTSQMLKVVFKIVDIATDSGEHRGPMLLNELIDAYGLDALSFLEKEAENVVKIVEAAKAASSQPSTLKPLLDSLDKVVANWTQVAKPIQMSMKSRGLVHDLSHRVGYNVRGLVIELVEEADDIDSAQRVVQMLGKYFSQFPEFAARVTEDLGQLENMAQKKLFADLLVPIRTLCKKATESADSDPRCADAEAQKIINDAPGLLNIAKKSGIPLDVIKGAEDEVAHAICSCAIDFGNNTSKWQICLALLESAQNFANGSAAIDRVHKNLEVVLRNVRLYGDLEPVDSAPSLYTINGCGVTLYGNTDADPETGSYMATYYFVLIFIPIFPICRYRVISSGNSSYRFLGKGKLRTFDKWHIATSAFIILLMFLQK